MALKVISEYIIVAILLGVGACPQMFLHMYLAVHNLYQLTAQCKVPQKVNKLYMDMRCSILKGSIVES